MNFKFLLFIFLSSTLSLLAQTSIIDTIEVDGLERVYRLHLPPNYSAEDNLPLVMNFHGYGSNAIQQELYTGLFLLANTENFVVCHPEGTLDSQGNQFFNVGFSPGETVDDVSFASTLIDNLVENYGLDATRVYSCGMSNGGYMSYKLACEAGEKIAAICSVTGSMMLAELEACQPSPIPVMQMHGTADATVLYEGNEYTSSIEDLVNYWVNVNACDPTPEITAIEDINTEDNTTAELYKYTDYVYGYDVHFYKIEGGGHTWPNSSINFGITNRDFNSNQVMWDFFKQYTNVLPEPSSNEIIDNKFSISPNPFENEIQVNDLDNSLNNTLNIYDIHGKLLITTTKNVIETGNLQNGIYFLEISNEKGKTTQKLIKQ